MVMPFRYTMALSRRARFCSWKIGTRTACPVLVDNLPADKLDYIWSDISRINYASQKDAYREDHKDNESHDVIKHDKQNDIHEHEQTLYGRTSNIKRRPRSR